MSNFKAPSVALFQPGLVWFNQADKNSPPCPAIPIEQTANGVLTLLVMRKQNSTVLTKLGVRHVDDPFLQSCMDARLDCGGWDVAAEDNAFKSAMEAAVRDAAGAVRKELAALRERIEIIEACLDAPTKGKKKELANA